MTGGSKNHAKHICCKGESSCEHMYSPLSVLLKLSHRFCPWSRSKVFSQILTQNCHEKQLISHLPNGRSRVLKRYPSCKINQIHFPPIFQQRVYKQMHFGSAMVGSSIFSKRPVMMMYEAVNKKAIIGRPEACKADERKEWIRE